MSYTKNPQVDDYLNTMPAWQKAVAERVRDLIHEAEPNIEEVIKRTVQPYFVYKGNIAAFLSAKDHLNVFLYDPIAPDPEKIINFGHGNATGRAIQIYENDTLNEKAFVALIQAIARNNDAGGWRKLQK